jgi:maleylpyruvate isomerase
MELYGAARSSASFRVRIALAYKGLGHDSGYVSLAKGEHAEAKYRSINTQGLVPALVDDGRLFAQSLAIIEYLEERYPEPPLLPLGFPDRAYVRAIAQMVACEMQPLNNLRTLNFLRTGCGLDESIVRVWYHHWIADGFAIIERYLSTERRMGRYSFGDMVTVADCCLVPQVFNAKRFECDLRPYPTVLEIFEQCMTLPAFERSQPSAQPDAV